ncbi:MAG: acyltransferase family protein [Thermoleophilia bacterium]|nr:acyltransferase family protein [Thermoleophilia bacterium]
MPRTSQSRIGWADLAKGACIALVVLRHVTNKQYRWLDWPASAHGIVGVWQELSVVLQPLRMPLFFLISGWFVASWLVRPLGRYLERRVLRPWWLFVAWIAVHGVIWLVLPPIHGVNRVEHWSQLPLELVWASSGIWYLYALAAFGLVARLTRRLPTAVVLAGAAVIAIASSALPFGTLDGNRYQVLANLVFFLIGARLPHMVRALGARAAHHGPITLLAAALFVALSIAAAQLHLRDAAGVVFVLGLLGVAAGIAVAVVVDGAAPRVSRRGAWLGMRTLPIYVMHVPLIALLDYVLRHSGAADRLTSGGTTTNIVAALYPILAVALVITVSLGINRLLAPIAPWLFDLPSRLGRLQGRRRA